LVYDPEKTRAAAGRGRSEAWYDPLAKPGARVILRSAAVIAFLLSAGCAGPVAEVTTIPAEEAAWQIMAPRLPGMPVAAVEQCAGPPRGVAPAPGSGTVLLYRAQDLKNYCQVSLLAQDGRVVSFTADHAAPEFLYLRDGSNYCGRIFQQCLR
jgi:hypothetical protein